MSTLSQAFPPDPKFTEKDVPELTGKTFLVTGGYSGVGLEVARVLYQKGGRVFIAGRSETSYEQAKKDIESTAEESKTGSLEFVKLDLSDLTTVKPAIDDFLTKVDRLDVVWYNAGVMVPPAGSKTKQGYELQWGTNVVAHFAIHKLLTPILTATAASSPAGTVRAIWVSSSVHTRSPKPYGINFEDPNYTKSKASDWDLYAQSKAGAVILAHEYAKLAKENAPVGEDGIKKGHVISLSLNPGNLKRNLQRSLPSVFGFFLNLILYPARLGGLTELYAGLSPETGEEDFNGGFVIPFGRKGDMVSYVRKGLEEAGTGKRLWDLLDEEVKQYA